ncbi:MAG: leucyl aminopeptidase [Sporomusaceae bacterium]|nr:leucyl aminopeptidase [Sporomusaceae bacterium]
MQIEIASAPITQISCNILIIHIFEDAPITNKLTIMIDKALSGNISTLISEQPSCCKYGEMNIIHTWDIIGAKRIMLLGMGKRAELTIDKIRSVSGTAMRAAQSLHAVSAATLISDLGTHNYDLEATAQAVVEGAMLGAYQFNCYKTKKPAIQGIDKFIIIKSEDEKDSAISQGMSKGKIIAESVNLARDLVNHPSKYMTPTQMAVQAQKIAEQNNLEIKILEQADMEEENMHALLSVAQGSSQPPKMIILKYNGDTTTNHFTAFVGKGVTFDSGGISIKPSLNMHEMKSDMAGGAAVLGAMLGIGKLKPKVNIIGIIPCTENMPSGHAYKPGDVISSMSGKTIEIINTDAEGRLILADAITYAQKLGAAQIIDIATLTGACVVALGHITSGLITNHVDFCSQLLRAANHAGEKMWELPNFPEYKDQIKSNIADLKNSGGRMAGAITAGLFIAEFVNDVPWVHIDIAGTAESDKDSGYYVKGGTGAGTRTLIQLAQDMSKC